MTSIENALSAVFEFAVALIVKLEVVSEPTAENPEIAPVDEFNVAPAGKDPDCLSK